MNRRWTTSEESGWGGGVVGGEIQHWDRAVNLGAMENMEWTRLTMGQSIEYNHFINILKSPTKSDTPVAMVTLACCVDLSSKISSMHLLKTCMLYCAIQIEKILDLVPELISYDTIVSTNAIYRKFHNMFNINK